MPLYYIHGFRWARKDIRIHVIMHNIEDAAPDYTMSSSSNKAMIASLRRTHPDIVAHLPDLQMVEEYDPADERLGSSVQEHAYLADKVVEHREGISMQSVQRQGVSNAVWQAMGDLKDELAKEENVAWYTVYNGDPERDDGMGKRELKAGNQGGEGQSKKEKAGVKKWFKMGKD